MPERSMFEHAPNQRFAAPACSLPGPFAAAMVES
jgi:hypothetical protein